MTSAFRDVLKLIIILASDTHPEHDGVSRETFAQTTSASGRTGRGGAIPDAPQHPDAELGDFLHVQSDATARKVQTLMYLGRDSKCADRSDIHRLHRYVQSRSDTVDDVIRTICESRIALPAWLGEGLRRAEEAGIDIEQSFE